MTTAIFMDGHMAPYIAAMEMFLLGVGGWGGGRGSH